MGLADSQRPGGRIPAASAPPRPRHLGAPRGVSVTLLTQLCPKEGRLKVQYFAVSWFHRREGQRRLRKENVPDS